MILTSVVAPADTAAWRLAALKKLAFLRPPSPSCVSIDGSAIDADAAAQQIYETVKRLRAAEIDIPLAQLRALRRLKRTAPTEALTK